MADIEVGARVQGRYQASTLPAWQTKWYGATVTAVHADGTFDLDYDDGDAETGVLAEHVRVGKGKSAEAAPRATGAAAPAPADASEPAEPPPASAAGQRVAAKRVSGKRKIVPTMVMVDGFAVKRQNMYDMEEGEGSVWDRELSGKANVGFEARERPDAAAAAQAAAAAAAAKAASKPKQEKKPRELSGAEQTRISRNEELRAARDAAVKKRAAFLQPHRAVLQRFGAKVPPLPPSTPGGFCEDPTLQQPSQILVPMHGYQLRGLRWLTAMHACGTNAILADEMGLGKTLQTIAFLAHLKFNLGVEGPHLVIAPLSVLSSWMSELKRFCPQLRVIKLHSSDAEERKRLMTCLTSGIDYDVVVTTYEMAKSPNVVNQLAHRAWWRYLIVDEGHVLKNDESQISQAVRRFHFTHALLLTGTPLQNNLHELWALLNFLYPEVFPESRAFDSAFNLGSGANGAQVDNEQLSAASSLLRPFMLRRIKDEVEKTLPDKLETKISCPLSEMQLFWYKRLLLRESQLLKQLEAEHTEHAGAAGADWKRLSSLLMQLRKCCNHPFLFPGVEPEPGAEYAEQLVAASGKMQVLARLLAKLYANGHRVVLFSQFTSTLDLLEEFLHDQGYKFCRLDGSTNRVQRTVDINTFNAPGSRRFCFLMSTRAGGLGINCQTADTCILFDSDWNPQVDMQAMARVHRIGQKKVVHIYRLVTSGSVEERIVQRAEKKLYLDQMVNRGSSAQSEELEQLSSSEMMSMLKFGANCCFKTEAAPTDAQLDAIIDRARKESDTIEGLGLQGGTQSSAADFEVTAPMLNLRELQGASYERKEEKKGVARMLDIGEEWAEMQASKRQHVSRMTTTHVTGVGQVSVLNENNYEMGQEMPNAQGGRGGAEKKQGRQVAGRDFAHEDRCLCCWKGAGGGAGGKSPQKKAANASKGLAGGLRGCDLCPAAFHLKCIGMTEADSSSWGLWSCPHHACSVCGRKAAAAGGLLFRCAVCPEAFCEDHLPPAALLMGECERFQALGCRHPAQGCYMLHSEACVRKSAALGFDCGEASASAAAILGATGVDTTASPAKGKKRKPAEPAPPAYATDQRSEWKKLQAGVQAALEALLAQPAQPLREACPTWRGKAALAAAPTSSLDLLHDLLHGTSLYESNRRNDAAYRDELIAKIGEFKGAAAERAAGTPKPRDKEEAAAAFLELVRQLEGSATRELLPMAKLLGVQRLQTANASDAHAVRLNPTIDGLGRKAIAPVLALVLTVPSEQALYYDNRPEQRARGAGDPGFLVTGEPLPNRLALRRGVVVDPWQEERARRQREQEERQRREYAAMRLRLEADRRREEEAAAQAARDAHSSGVYHIRVIESVGQAAARLGVVPLALLQANRSQLGPMASVHTDLFRGARLFLPGRAPPAPFAFPVAQGFEQGAEVVLTGLQSRAELNGCPARIESFDPVKERYQVRLTGRPAGDATTALAIKKVNLQPIRKSLSPIAMP